MDSRRLIVGDSLSEVVRLHERPRISDLTVPGDDVGRTFSGLAARDAASKYQAERGLAPTAIVDERTAGTIHTALPRSRSLAAPADRSVADGRPCAPPAPNPLPDGQDPNPGRLLCLKPR